MASTWKHLAQIRWPPHAHSNRRNTKKLDNNGAVYCVTGLIPCMDRPRVNILNSYKNLKSLIRRPVARSVQRLRLKCEPGRGKTCVGETASRLIVSCGLSNGLNMLYKSRGSVLCVRRGFDHNTAPRLND